MLKSERKIMISILFVLLLSLSATAYAEVVELSSVFSLYSSEWTHFSLSEAADSHSLYSAYYFSDDEIWCSISSDTYEVVLKRVDTQGQLVNEILFADLPGDDPTVECITRIGDKLMIGFIDSVTQDGLIIVLDSENQEISRISLSDSVSVMRMSAATQGILCSGFFYDEQSVAHFYLSLVNDTSEIVFENKELYDDAELIHVAIQESLSCAGIDQYYAVIGTGVNGHMQPLYTLTCFDQDGNIQWETPLPEKTSIYHMAGSSDRVYLFGLIGDLNENEILINHRAYICCYTNDGTLAWDYVFEEPEMFYRGVVNEEGCIATSGASTDPFYICSFDSNGNIRFARFIELPASTKIRGYFIVDQTKLLVLGGRWASDLFMFQVE